MVWLSSVGRGSQPGRDTAGACAASTASRPPASRRRSWGHRRWPIRTLPSPRIIGSVSCWLPEKRSWALCSGCKYTRLSSRVSDRCYGDLRTRYKLTDLSYRIPEKCIWIMCPSCVLTNLSCWIPANSARYMCTSYKLRICKSVWISYSGSKSSDDTHSTPGNI